MGDLIQIRSVDKGPGISRLLEIEVGSKHLVTPTYFPAISRKAIRDPGNTFLELIAASEYPRLLVSAYDYGRVGTHAEKRVVRKLRQYCRSGSILVLDSGIFESYWREDSRWSFEKYRESIETIDCDFYLSFDVLQMDKQNEGQFRRLTLD